MEYMTIKETAELWNLSQRWIQTMCANGKIEGAKEKSIERICNFKSII